MILRKKPIKAQWGKITSPEIKNPYPISAERVAALEREYKADKARKEIALDIRRKKEAAERPTLLNYWAQNVTKPVNDLVNAGEEIVEGLLPFSDKNVMNVGLSGYGHNIWSALTGENSTNAVLGTNEEWLKNNNKFINNLLLGLTTELGGELALGAVPKLIPKRIYDKALQPGLKAVERYGKVKPSKVITANQIRTPMTKTEKEVAEELSNLSSSLPVKFRYDDMIVDDPTVRRMIHNNIGDITGYMKYRNMNPIQSKEQAMFELKNLMRNKKELALAKHYDDILDAAMTYLDKSTKLGNKKIVENLSKLEDDKVADRLFENIFNLRDDVKSGILPFKIGVEDLPKGVEGQAGWWLNAPASLDYYGIKKGFNSFDPKVREETAILLNKYKLFDKIGEILLDESSLNNVSKDRLYDIVSHELKHYNMPFAGPELTRKLASTTRFAGTGSGMIGGNKFIKGLLKRMNYFSNPTEIVAYLGTNLRDALLRKGYIKDIYDEITEDMLKNAMKSGEITPLNMYKRVFNKNWANNLAKVLPYVPYGAAPAAIIPFTNQNNYKYDTSQETY